MLLIFRKSNALILTTFSYMAIFATPLQAISLKESLLHAYEHNPTILAARAELKQADETVSEARSNFLPNLSASRSFSRANTRTLETGNAARTGDRTDTLSLSQSLFSYSNYKELKKANLTVTAQRLRLQASEQQVLLQVISSYMDVVRGGRVAKLRESNVKVLKQHLKTTQVQFELRRRTNSDLAQARSRLARGKADLAAAHASERKARSNFLQVVGFKPVNLEQPKFFSILPDNIKAAEELALKQKPTVRAASFEVDAARIEIEVKMGKFAPNLTLSGSIANANSMNRNDENSNTLTSSASVTFTVPLYQRGTEYSGLRSARIALSKSIYTLDQARRTAGDGARQAWEDMVSAEVRVDSYSAQVKAAEIALKGIKAELEVGRRTLLNLLDAEQEFLDARVNYTSANRDYLVAQYRILERTGQLRLQDIEIE